MERFQTLRSRTVVLPQQNIDTDQIIPARFLKTTERRGLGRSLFADWRYDERGAPRADFPLNRPEAADARILVAGDNFACGSSREHAPWALVDAGFRAVISSSIADIFRNNAAKNGLLALVVPAQLQAALLAAPGATVTVDLEQQTVHLGDEPAVRFPIDPFARYCLLEGVDELGFLLRHEGAIARFESSRPTPEESL